jgi:thioredoxin-related protein
MQENQIILTLLIILIILLLYIMKLKRKYNTNLTPLGQQIKDLDIIFLKMSTCPYCIKMESVLLNKNMLNNLRTIDVNTPYGRKLAQDYQCTGFPSFVSEKTKKKTSGYTEDLESLVNELK